MINKREGSFPLFFLLLTKGKLLLTPNKVYAGVNKIDLTKDTIYTHPQEKQCNYTVDSSMFATKDDLDQIRFENIIYSKYTTIDTTSTYIVPKTGKYRIIAIGKGGDGGGSHTYKSVSMTRKGGASGGIGILTTTLTEGTSYQITIGSDASFGSLITATGGEKGSFSSRVTDDPVGGTASGDGVIVYPGNSTSNADGADCPVILVAPGENIVTEASPGQYYYKGGNGGIGCYGSVGVGANGDLPDNVTSNYCLARGGGGYGAGGGGGGGLNYGGGDYYYGAGASGGRAAIIIYFLG